MRVCAWGVVVAVCGVCVWVCRVDKCTLAHYTSINYSRSISIAAISSLTVVEQLEQGGESCLWVRVGVCGCVGWRGRAVWVGKCTLMHHVHQLHEHQYCFIHLFDCI